MPPVFAHIPCIHCQAVSLCMLAAGQMSEVGTVWAQAAGTLDPGSPSEGLITCRLILFLQQSSVEWCSSLWLHVVQAVDPNCQRTVLISSKFDNRIKEFSERWEVGRPQSDALMCCDPGTETAAATIESQ